jgi:hypothetical protein
MNAWDIRSDDERSLDSLPTFIIFCEDMVSEPVYLKYFETAAIKVNPIKCKKSKMDNVLHAITHCIQMDWMEERNGEKVLVAGDTQVWCIFDRDGDKSPDKDAVVNVEFDESIAMAIRRGIKLAWSNDAFELWVLLHFENINPTEDVSRHRKTYYERLTTIFKGLPNPNDDLKKCLAYQHFDYKSNLKSETNFRAIVRPAILPQTTIAIERAKHLVDFHRAHSAPLHRQAPCTLVFQLVEELLRVGGKKL